MAEKLIIWITDDSALEARWLVLDANGNRIGFPQHGPLESAASLAANRRVTVLLPGERILAADAHVPGSNVRRIMQAAPYALEERLAGDVDALHVTLLSHGSNQHCDFLVVERERFARLLAAIEATGIHVDHAWPDYFGIPVEAGHAHWLILGNRVLGREGWSGFAAPANDAAFLYTHRDSEAPLHLTIVGDQSPPSAMAELEVARIDDADRALMALADGITTLPGSGLLQGAFRRTREGNADLRRWRWPAVAAAAWLALVLGTTGIDAWRLAREYTFLDNAVRELFDQALPGSRLVEGQARFLVEQALGNISTTEEGALTHIADVAHAMQDVPNARLNGFNFRNNQFEMSVTVPDATVLESLRTALAQRAGQSVEVQSANSTRDGLEGRLLIAGGGE